MAATTIRRRARIRPGGILSGFLIGLALLVLLQQFSVLYPSAAMAVIFLVGGVVVGLLLPWLAGSMRGRRRPPAPVATGPAVVEPPPSAPPPAPVSDTPAAAVTPGPWAPTHTVPAGGLNTYEHADDGTPSQRLDPGLEVQVVERVDTRARVVCSNGWSCWVEGASLQVIAP